jgi:hypothetical protein
MGGPAWVAVGPRLTHAENAKEKTNHGSKGPRNPKSVLGTLAISVCQLRIRRGNSHRDRKEHKGTADHGSKGHPNRICLSDLCDLCVSNSDQKRRSTRRSQRTQRERMTMDPRVTESKDVCDLCVSNSDQKRRSTRRSQRTQRKA